METSRQTPSSPPSEILDRVRGTAAYIDSVEIQQARFFRSDYIKHIRENSGGTYGPSQKPTYESRFVNSIYLHQPRPAALESMPELTSAITRVHVALDVYTANFRDARRIHDYAEARLVQDLTPRREVRCFHGRTTYFDDSVENRAGRCLVIYSHRPSKVSTDQPCCHLELRLSGADELRAAGLRSLEGLLNLDLRAFFRRRLMLRELPDEEWIGDRWLQRLLSRKTPDRSLVIPWGRSGCKARVGSMILRHIQSGRDGRTRAHDLAHLLALHPELAGTGYHCMHFPAVSTDWMLPDPINALWRAD
ncbi:hypothetical protein JJB11_07540 [Ramlibacter ginsenosidimutans]|uniref:Uncharacterized protein n=1 Tax=Ramlibacter ginsenosidimutans TaxID=502333 RepID=A0A934WLU2_9BURK|nr:hypothetical protein [Ramlibacter ginsenosidimutans]MBK6005945.1 hypothetical protein [Ramlibacter ginsenosidimutans]